MNELTLDIAFASNDEKNVNQHFGSCLYLTIYRLTRHDSEHLENISFELIKSNNKQKISNRLKAIKNCFAVYSLGCGNPVRQQLLTQGTRTVIKEENQPIAEILKQIQGNWPGAIAIRQQQHLIKKQDKHYFEKLANSQWD